MDLRYYWTLDARGEPKRVTSLRQWAEWIDKNLTGTCRVKREDVEGAEVSTVFLGLDYSFEHHGRGPILWETMVFGGPLDEEMDRCGGTREQAEAMHAAMVERVRAVSALADT